MELEPSIGLVIQPLAPVIVCRALEVNLAIGVSQDSSDSRHLDVENVSRAISRAISAIQIRDVVFVLPERKALNVKLVLLEHGITIQLKDAKIATAIRKDLDPANATNLLALARVAQVSLECNAIAASSQDFTAFRNASVAIVIRLEQTHDRMKRVFLSDATSRTASVCARPM